MSCGCGVVSKVSVIMVGNNDDDGNDDGGSPQGKPLSCNTFTH